MVDQKSKQILKTIDKPGTENLLREMREYFDEGHLRNISYRKYLLLRLKEVIKAHEEEIQKALYQDLGKSPLENYTAEIGIIYESINESIFINIILSSF